MPAALLPPLNEQAERLIELNIHKLARLSAAELRAATAVDEQGALFVVHPERAPASTLAGLLKRFGKQGFVVADMPDVDKFTPVKEVPLPASPTYLLSNIDRGDHMANWSPNEALPVITSDGRTPLTLTEGIHWLLQQPEMLERNHCFMTIGSRLHKDDNRLDSRTPAIWISNGTGRDGAANRNAPKIGWCWAGNRHTWLGFATAATRNPLSF